MGAQLHEDKMLERRAELTGSGSNFTASSQFVDQL
jgi:hypothetical protein